MNTLSEHYGLLLGLDRSWRVVDVDLSLEEKRVQIQIEHVPGAAVCCPECSAVRPLKDHAPQRSWRHLDTMQFETLLTARIPRTECPDCGVKTIEVPWAEPHGRFTLVFEAFAVRLLQVASSIEKARLHLRLSWMSVQRIMDRAVERGLITRDLTDIRHVGLDEKSFLKGQDYVSIMTDIDGSRVLEVSPGRDETAADTLWNTFSWEQKEQIEAVAMDMWQAYQNSVDAHAPDAEVVHDRFHIAKHLNEAVDQVRRAEHKSLMKEQDETLKGTRSLWLYNLENLSEQKRAEFEQIKGAQLKTARAWAIREQFRWFWDCRSAEEADEFFQTWFSWAIRCRLKPIKRVAKMIKKRIDNILSWFRHQISNAAAEGFNSIIQSLKSAARGFRNFANYRTRILFFCGKLKLLPESASH
ncbi:ISL3 family transposase [Planctomicrobium sp. SH661]|uniref:ISL3 family transposase n=1 Tax=Planctomicrobium sp. SH661 TaxID=3448124 RepID=UPI003F5B8C3E